MPSSILRTEAESTSPYRRFPPILQDTAALFSRSLIQESECQKDFLDYIFVPFSRAEDAKACHIQGTGLGMPIALGIVTAMQG